MLSFRTVKMLKHCTAKHAALVQYISKEKTSLPLHTNSKKGNSALTPLRTFSVGSGSNEN